VETKTVTESGYGDRRKRWQSNKLRKENKEERGGRRVKRGEQENRNS